MGFANDARMRFMGNDVVFQVKTWFISSLSAFITLLVIHAIRIKKRINRENELSDEQLKSKSIPVIIFDMLTLEIFEKRIKTLTYWSTAIGIFYYIFQTIIKEYFNVGT